MLPTLKRNTNNVQVLYDIAPQGELKSKLSALFNTAHLSRSVETDLDVSKLVNSLSNELYGNAKQVYFIWDTQVSNWKTPVHITRQLYWAYFTNANPTSMVIIKNASQEFCTISPCKFDQWCAPQWGFQCYPFASSDRKLWAITALLNMCRIISALQKYVVIYQLSDNWIQAPFVISTAPSRTQGSALLYCIEGPLWASSILLNNRQSKICSDHATMLRVRLFYGSVHICNNQRWHQIMEL